MANFQCKHPTHETLQYPRVCCNRYQGISKHIKTCWHNTSQYVLLDQRRQPITIQAREIFASLLLRLVVLLATLLAISSPAKAGGISRRLINICFIASPMPKNTPFYPPQSGVFKKPTMTLWVVPFYDTATTHQGSTENDVNTLRYFYQKRNMFFPA